MGLKAQERLLRVVQQMVTFSGGTPNPTEQTGSISLSSQYDSVRKTLPEDCKSITWNIFLGLSDENRQQLYQRVDFGQRMTLQHYSRP